MGGNAQGGGGGGGGGGVGVGLAVGVCIGGSAQGRGGGGGECICMAKQDLHGCYVQHNVAFVGKRSKLQC